MNELSLFVLDIARNGIEAGASLIEITVSEQGDTTDITISDNGCGMDEKESELSLKRGYSTKGKLRGDGLPSLIFAAEKSGGYVKVVSQKGKGTTVKAVFNAKNSPPLGDINSTIKILCVCHVDVDFIFIREREGKTFSFNTAQIKHKLGEVRISSPQVVQWMNDYLNEQTQTIFGGAVDEIIG